jgi:hypothetical protein
MYYKCSINGVRCQQQNEFSLAGLIEGIRVVLNFGRKLFSMIQSSSREEKCFRESEPKATMEKVFL